MAITYFYSDEPNPPEINVLVHAVLKYCEDHNISLPYGGPTCHGHFSPQTEEEFNDISIVGWPTGFDATGTTILGPRPANMPTWQQVVEYMHRHHKEGIYYQYQQDRKRNYPDVGQYLDAFVKGDEAAMERYKADCLAVKESIPKPVDVPPHLA
jgi:hypothetical protein